MGWGRGSLKTKNFARFARREGIEDDALCEAISRAERGLVDADLGGGVVKQRIPRPGQGRFGGFRTIVLYRTEDRAVFVDGFAKSDQDNIDDDDLERFQKLVDAGAWIEVECDDKEVREQGRPRRA